MSHRSRHGIFLSLVAWLLVTTMPALATELFVDNQLENKISVSVVYFDKARDSWVTKGWYNLDGVSEKTFTIHNADPSKGAYYYAETGGGERCADSNQLGKTMKRWIDKASFTFAGSANSKPDGKAVRLAPFLPMQYSEGFGGWVLRIDRIPNG